MPPLKNLKHEQFVQAFPNSPTAYQAYQETFHTPTQGASRTGSSMLLNRPEVKNRLLEVFEERGLNEDYISNKLHDLTNAHKENVQLGAIRTILEVRKDIESANKLGVQVVVNTEAREKLLGRFNKYQQIIDASNA